jgi:hypothetical protein
VLVVAAWMMSVVMGACVCGVVCAQVELLGQNKAEKTAVQHLIFTLEQAQAAKLKKEAEALKVLTYHMADLHNSSMRGAHTGGHLRIIGWV